MTGFFHLDYQPKNIFTEEDRLGLIDLEFACSVGDPALELGWLLGCYLHWGLAKGRRDSALEAAQALLEAYRKARAETWAGLAGRVTAFAGACLAVEFERVDLGGTLLRRGLEEGVVPEAALEDLFRDG